MRLEIWTPNASGYPIIEIPLADHDEIDEVGRFLFDHGIYVTMAAYPLVPKDEVGFRVQVTAANTDEEIDPPDRRPDLGPRTVQAAGPGPPDLGSRPVARERVGAPVATPPVAGHPCRWDLL